MIPDIRIPPNPPPPSSSDLEVDVMIEPLDPFVHLPGQLSPDAGAGGRDLALERLLDPLRLAEVYPMQINMV